MYVIVRVGKTVLMLVLIININCIFIVIFIYFSGGGGLQILEYIHFQSPKSGRKRTSHCWWNKIFNAVNVKNVYSFTQLDTKCYKLWKTFKP